MGWEMTSETWINGEAKAIKEINGVLQSHTIEVQRQTGGRTRFDGMTTVVLKEETPEEIFVLLSTHKRTPTDFFEYCESLGCEVNAETACMEDAEIWSTSEGIGEGKPDKECVGVGYECKLGTVVRLDATKGVTVENQGVEKSYSFAEFESHILA